MLGPLDYVILGFKGSNFDGSVMDALVKAADKNIIRVIDLVFVMKDKDGNVLSAEYEDQSAELMATFGDFQREEDLPLLSESDIAQIGEQMESDTAAGILIIEHLWAKDLKQSIIDAGGFLLDRGRINEAAVDIALEDLEKTAVQSKGKKKIGATK